MTPSVDFAVRPSWRAYYELTKPRVVALMLLTAYVGMHLAAPGWVPLQVLVFGLGGIALCAGSAAVINHMVDHRFDAVMGRTKRRPLPTGRVSMQQAGLFAAVLGIVGTFLLLAFINTLTAVLTVVTLLGYAVVYTMFLKHVTSQNIVIGGLAGAAPPLLGWVAVTGHIDAPALLLVMLIFVWTPPHFWALSIYRYEDYAEAHIPMLPVTHGIPITKLCILLYTILLLAVSLLPYAIGMSGWVYLVNAIVLGLVFVYYSVMLLIDSRRRIAMQTFRYSIIYLMVLFVVLLVDHAMVV